MFVETNFPTNLRTPLESNNLINNLKSYLKITTLTLYKDSFDMLISIYLNIFDEMIMTLKEELNG
jgi:hypothetical protein